MKKLILKTALITFGVTLIIGVSLFGILSFCAPATMMRFFDSVGLRNISGDYAYQEYQNSKDLEYLAIAFEFAAQYGSPVVANERFDELYASEGFEEFCKLQNSYNPPDGALNFDYRATICATAACLKYRLAATLDDKVPICDFALKETSSEFTGASPVVVLAAEAIWEKDVDFCSMLLDRIKETKKFDVSNKHYLNIVNKLEEASSNE